MAVDIKGKELAIGDKVAFVRVIGKGHSLGVGYIQEIHGTYIVINEDKNYEEPFIRRVFAEQNSLKID